MQSQQRHGPGSGALRLSVALALLALGSLTSSATAQEALVLANDGTSLATQSFETRAMFQTVHGPRAATRWVTEHEAQLAVGAPARPIKLAFMNQTNGIGDIQDAQRGAFLETLMSLGYQPGRDLVISWHYPARPSDPLDGMANEIVSSRPDVILVGSTPPSQAIKRATSTIPVVFNGSGDPIGVGLVPNLEHPGGNITGVQTFPLSVNQTNVDLLKDLVPGMTRLGVMRSAINPLPGVFDSVQAAAERRGITVQSIVVQTVPDDLPAAIDAAVAGRVDALLQIPDATFSPADLKRIAEMAIAKRIPYLGTGRPAVVDGARLATTTVTNANIRVAARLVDKIIKGAKPGDLAVTAPVVDVLVVNLKTAQSIGLSVPDSVLARATEIIR
jgi:putative ABC transport system substrate-binding protein